LYVVFPLLGNLGLREDRSDRTDRHAGVAVDAFLRMNEELVFIFIEACNRTDLDAGAILGPDAWVSDDVGHLVLLKVSAYIVHTPLLMGKQKPSQFSPP
jgi:hypothetical protein